MKVRLGVTIEKGVEEGGEGGGAWVEFVEQNCQVKVVDVFHSHRPVDETTWLYLASQFSVDLSRRRCVRVCGGWGGGEGTQGEKEKSRLIYKQMTLHLHSLRMKPRQMKHLFSTHFVLKHGPRCPNEILGRNVKVKAASRLEVWIFWLQTHWCLCWELCVPGKMNVVVQC